MAKTANKEQLIAAYTQLFHTQVRGRGGGAGARGSGGRAGTDGCRPSPSPQRFKGTDGAEKAAEKAKPAKAEEAKGKAAKPEEAVEEVGAAPRPRLVGATVWGGQIIQVFKNLVTERSLVPRLKLTQLLSCN